MNLNFQTFYVLLETASKKRPASSLPPELYEQSKEAYLEKAEAALRKFIINTLNGDE